MTCEMFVVSPQHIDRAWRDGAHRLSEATERTEDCTASQLKYRLATGELTLLKIEPDSWYVVDFLQLANMRVLHIHAMYARGNTTDRAMELLSEYAKAGGASSIQCAAYGGAARIFERRFGFNEVYKVMRKPLWTADQAK